MALTRSMLKAMDLEEEKVESIIAAHAETVDGLKGQIERLEKKAEGVESLEKKIEELESQKPTEDWEAKYKESEARRDGLAKEFEGYREKVAAEKAEAEKASLYRSILARAGVDAKRIDSIMKVSDLSDLSVEDGKLKDDDKIEKAVAEEWADFIPKVVTKGMNVATPPQTSKVDGASPEVRARLKERHERMYGAQEQS